MSFDYVSILLDFLGKLRITANISRVEENGVVKIYLDRRLTPILRRRGINESWFMLQLISLFQRRGLKTRIIEKKGCGTIVVLYK